MKGTKDMKKGNSIPCRCGGRISERDLSYDCAVLHVLQPFFMLFLSRLLESVLPSGVLTATQRGRVNP